MNIEQIFKKLADVGRADEIFQAQLAHPPPQIHPQVFLIEQLERRAPTMKQLVAPGMKRAGLQAFDICALEFQPHPLLHFRSRVIGISERQNLIRPRVALPNKVRDALNQNGSLAGPSASDNDHRPMHMLDSLPLTIIRNNLLHVSGNVGKGTHLPEHIRAGCGMPVSVGSLSADVAGLEKQTKRGRHHEERPLKGRVTP